MDKLYLERCNQLRTENEMMDLILDAAKNDERIRAVVINGSRADDFILYKDKYQDYDIVYLVTDFQYFVDNRNWIDIFGARIMLEMPTYQDVEPSDYNGYFNYQMLFTDGNRIDLTFASLDKIHEIAKDEVGRVLLDKDNRFTSVEYDNSKKYFVKKPSKKDFENKCNTFWWSTQNIAKGIKRKELPYVMKMFNWVRDDLDDIISWHIGMNNDYNVSSGKMGRYFVKYLDNDIWKKYVSTFPSGEYDEIWSALFFMCGLFQQLATKIADEYSYEYPHQDDKLMTEHLYRLRNNRFGDYEKLFTQ
jgi:aminoglycoside 6-adenylyltransferase